MKNSMIVSFLIVLLGFSYNVKLEAGKAGGYIGTGLLGGLVGYGIGRSRSRQADYPQERVVVQERRVVDTQAVQNERTLRQQAERKADNLEHQLNEKERRINRLEDRLDRLERQNSR